MVFVWLSFSKFHYEYMILQLELAIEMICVIFMIIFERFFFLNFRVKAVQRCTKVCELKKGGL